MDEHRTTREDLEWWLDTAPSLKWQFATSMPGAPHSYVVRHRTFHDPDFLRAVKVIRTFGQPGKFWDRTNIYLTVGTIKWWTMGDTLDGTIIINMATTEKKYGRQDAPVTKSPYSSIYDQIACDYDARYLTAKDIEENETMARLIRRHFGAYAPRTLDVGCGTGLLLDLGITAPGMYVGVDPSQGMLNELIRKHTRIKNIYPAKMEDVLEEFPDRSFECVVSLFGSASYIAPGTIKALPDLSTDLTVLMHYKEGYLPDYYGGQRPDPDYVDASREAARSLPDADRWPLNNFEVTVLRG